jgi:CBS-domain-containing membrane protein
MNISSISTREVDTARVDETARTAAQRMQARNVGTLVVVDDENRVIGILTDRDLALRVVARGVDPNVARVAQVMTSDVQTVPSHASAEQAVRAMRERGVRRLPVVFPDSTLAGLLSLDDVLTHVADELAEVRRFLDATSPRSMARGAAPVPAG